MFKITSDVQFRKNNYLRNGDNGLIWLSYISRMRLILSLKNEIASFFYLVPEKKNKTK